MRLSAELHTGLTAEGHLIESLFRIPDKDRNEVDFILNDAQLTLDRNMTGRDIIPKARQRGVTSYWLARFTAACLRKENVNAVVISHEAEATARQLQKVRYFLDRIKGPKAHTGSMSQHMITFPKTGSSFYIGTAGSRAFGRGDTITHLLCTEYAYWPDGPTLLNGLLDCVPESGEAVIESTGNGKGNDYHRRCMAAWRGESYWKCHFLPWHEQPEYCDILTPEEEEQLMANLREEWEEPQLVGILTPGQLSWRRRKLADKDYNLDDFKQEYPLTIEECFKSTGSSLFHQVLYFPSKEWVKVSPWEHRLLGYPKEGHRYSIGADVSAGVGKDDSVAVVWDVDDEKQVCEYVNNRITPDKFAKELVRLGLYYNDAFLVPEANNHGILLISTLLNEEEGRPLYPEHLIWRRTTGAPVDTLPKLAQFGLLTTSKTRPLIIGLLRKALASTWQIFSPMLRDQLDTFVENPDTKKVEAQEGQKDDIVMAAALGQLGVQSALMLDRRKLRPVTSAERLGLGPFTLDNIMKELHSRAGGNVYPIKSHLRGSGSR